MGVAIWIGMGVAAWLTLAAVVAWCIGRMVRKRDEQVPPAAALGGQPGSPRDAGGRRAHAERYQRGQG